MTVMNKSMQQRRLPRAAVDDTSIVGEYRSVT